MGVIWVIVACVWGVAEATVFFIVPDVILTYATVRHGWRAGFKLAIFAATSAALAGIGMWMWGHFDPVAAEHALLMVPAIGPDQLARSSREMAGFWPLNLLLGAITGVPYKLYAVAAGRHGVNLAAFAVASYVARLARFAFSVGVTDLGLKILRYLGQECWAYHLLTAGWVMLYAVYFTLRAAAS